MKKVRLLASAQKLKITVAAVVIMFGVAIFAQSTQPVFAASVWSNSTTPAVASDTEGKAVEVGMKFRSSVATNVTGLKFYKGNLNTGTHKGTLWSRTGTSLASVTFTNETATGWQTANFASPVAITANTTYVISYFAPKGGYSIDTNYFANSAVTNGTVTALQNGTDGGNGVYKYGTASVFPNATYNASNYWVDVITSAASTGDTTAPTVSLTAPAAGASVSGTTTVTASASDNVGVSSVQFKLDGVNLGSADTTAPYSVAWDTTTATNGSHALTATAVDAATNSTTSSVVSVTVSNQTTPNPSPSPGPSAAATIWPNTVTPAVAADSDSAPVELGLKFRSSTATTVAGVRFYKGTGNSGTHSGSLWNAAGTRLATVNFTNESTTGWQVATFATPVAIAANTTYVISYFAPNGHYAYNTNYFASSFVNQNLTALQNGTDGGNGIYKYASASSFPTDSFNASNYWVDVIMGDGTIPTDTTKPLVSAVTPVTNATNVATNSVVTATFNEALLASSVTSTSASIKNAQNVAVAANVTYDSATNKVTISPTSTLTESTQYTATLTTGIKDAAGNALAANFVWSFTTQAPVAPSPVDPLSQGNDGPVLIVTKTGQPFSAYYSEILRAEGLNSFKTVEVSTVTAAMLANYDVVILGDFDLTAAQVTTYTDWLTSGGNLIAMSPDKKLAGLLGLTDQSATLGDAYLKVDTSVAPGAGITPETIQFHGTADKYTTTSGTTTVASLYSSATAATTNPAVTIRSVGTNGGSAVAFTYDLARSIVLTHQGNPAWSGDDRDGNGLTRPNDLYYGNKTGDVKADYVDLNKVAIPQADEQQRLLANVITEVNKDRKPLPKLAYFPYNKKAVVVLAADDHANGRNSVSALNFQKAESKAGCVVADWECIRSTSLIYTNTDISNAEVQAYYNEGFDFGVHINTGCAAWTPTSLGQAIDSDVAAFKQKYTGLPNQTSSRTHCIAWSDYVSSAKVEQARGIRLDLNYYYWPGTWVQKRAGFMTGSGMSMRFADVDGTMINTFQLPSHLVNEAYVSEATKAAEQNTQIETLLSKAVGSEGYYGVFGTHYDYSDSYDRYLVNIAKAKDIPLVSGQQWVDWTDGRNNSYFTNSSWNGNAFSFTATMDGKTRSMARGLLPLTTKNGVLQTLTRNGQNVAFATETIKGVTYAVYTSTSGTYTANYGADTTAPTVRTITPTANQTAVVPSTNIDIAFSEPLDASTVNGTNIKLLSGSTQVAAAVSYNAGTNTVTIDPTANLASLTSYTVSVSTAVKDANGNALATSYASSFSTKDNSVSLWAPSTQTVTQASDTDLELGLRFQSSLNGKITAISFYKAIADTQASHTVTLWDAAGNSKGTATSVNETSSGWQTAYFSTPLAISLNTVYVASYRSPSGQHTYTQGGLSSNFVNGPLTALANGGVYRYGGGFPSATFNGTNYWVDVTFVE